jgi:poly(A) polymerase
MSFEDWTDEPPEESEGDRPRIVHDAELVAKVQGEHAQRVISRLVRHGFEAYLVGGCVRDLLVGRPPKDFDVVTDAHPRQIKRLFPRNSHIIGRRFRLVHVRYGKDTVIETATFRREPESRGIEDDPLILEDNEYGTAAEDARRRDFTVNGLFLDPTRGLVIDYVGGLEDLEARVLRTIGDPFVRIPEDPVRILRAIKFATRLDFRIDDATWEAMTEYAPGLARSAPPRVLEEVLRLLRSGTALGAFRKMRSCGALAVVLPELDGYLGPLEGESPEERRRAEVFWRLLEALDAEVRGGHEPSTALLIALLHHDIVDLAAAPSDELEQGSPNEWARAAGRILEPLAGRARLSRRDSAWARKLIVCQRNFTRMPGRRFRPRLFCLAEEFPEALELFKLRTTARGQGRDIYEGWLERYRQAQESPDEEIEQERKSARRRPRRRRGRPAGAAGD